jgi:hypothetical protein
MDTVSLEFGQDFPLMLSEKADSLRVGFHTALLRLCTHWAHLSRRGALNPTVLFAAQHVLYKST